MNLAQFSSCQKGTNLRICGTGFRLPKTIELLTCVIIGMSTESNKLQQITES